MKLIRIIYIYSFLGYALSQLLNGNYGPRLDKYGKINVEVKNNDPFGEFIFNSADFKNGEEIYFKIKAKNNTLDNEVEFRYADDNHLPGIQQNDVFVSKFEGINDYDTINGVSYITRHFTITKDPVQFKGADGNNIYITFVVLEPGIYEVENTKEDEGKLPTWAIVVIVIAVVIVIVVMVGLYCYRRKKQLAMAAQTTGAVVGVNQYDNQYMQPNANYNPDIQAYPQANYDPAVQQPNLPMANY